MQIREIIQKICDFHEPYEEPPKTRDKYLAGDPSEECTGIIVTVCATMEILKEAVRIGSNLIISHESVYCGVTGGMEEMEKNDAAKEKLTFIQENHLVIWRYHDHMHGSPFDPARTRPDYIFYGICKELGWDSYVMDDPMKPTLYQIPETSARELAKLLMEKFNLQGLRIVGNLDARISKVCMAEHAMGDKIDHSMIHCMEADAFIPFEICDFTLTQYVNDSAAQGKNKVLLEMGHFNCEELGMKYAASYLPKVIGGSCPVTFVQSGDLFQYIRRGE